MTRWQRCVALLVLCAAGVAQPVQGAQAWTRIADPLYYGRSLALLKDGRVLVAGNRACSTPTACTDVPDAQIYNPASNSWSRAGAMSAIRVPTLTVLGDGRVLAVGGGTSDASGGTSQLYDPATNTWSAPIAAPRTRLMRHTATLLRDGRVLVVGGHALSVGTLADADIFDPSTGRWSVAAPMHRPRGAHTATLLGDGRVLVVGPWVRYWDAGLSTEGAEIYDPTTNTWTLTRANPYGTGFYGYDRYGHQTSLLPDGTVLVSGGCCQNPPRDNRVCPCDLGRPVMIPSHLYAPGADLWHPAPPTAPRHRHAAVTLADGRIMIIGGKFQPVIAGNFSQSLATTEIYDPALRTWTAGPSLTGTREWPLAVILNDGSVLVLGGSPNDDGYPMLTAEILRS